MRRNKEAAIRAAARRERENQAARLREAVPNIDSLVLNIKERGAKSSDLAVEHIRRVVVDRAPALFEIPCCDRRCNDGGHDITTVVVAALAAGETVFEGSDRCHGATNEGDCSLELFYQAQASYA
jgi:hypothetical protein